MISLRKRKAQAVVELAILFPFFLLIVVGGIIDFGFAFYNLIALQQIANDTAQYAVDPVTETGRGEADITAFVNSRKPVWWSGSIVASAATLNTADGVAKTKRISLSYNSQTYTPFYRTVMEVASGNSSIPVTAMVVFQIPKNVAVGGS